jgi:hypothetical protein
MITQRFTGDEGSMEGRLIIENTAGDLNGYAELQSLHAELALRANIKTESSVIVKAKVNEMPPIPPPAEG